MLDALIHHQQAAELLADGDRTLSVQQMKMFFVTSFKIKVVWWAKALIIFAALAPPARSTYEFHSVLLQLGYMVFF